MPIKWVRVEKGIRYREHPERRHGQRPDRYFVLRFTVDGARRQEALGWASEGWTLERARVELAKLREAKRTGKGERTLAEKRARADAERMAAEEAKEQEERANITLGDVWAQYSVAPTSKAPNSVRSEESLWRLHVGPALSGKPVKDIVALDLERLKAALLKKGLSPRSVQYALALVRQLFNFGRRARLTTAHFFTGEVKPPKVDNRRMRFLNVDEEVQLLAALAERSMDVHDMALLSLDCGLRAGEIFKLAWSDVDLAGGLLALRGTKSGHNRHAFITARVHSMLESRGPKKPSALVFPPRRGARITQISKLFGRVVADLGLNFGITDPLQKEVFHSLRHTFASKLVGQGVDLYRVQVSWATRPPQWSNGMPT